MTPSKITPGGAMAKEVDGDMDEAMVVMVGSDGTGTATGMGEEKVDTGIPTGWKDWIELS